MAVNANTNKTYDVTTLREDIQEALISISPTDTVFMSSIGTKTIDNTYFEWATVDLAAPDASNRVIEGDNPGNDAATNAVRLGNYAQLSDKVVEVSSTANAVRGVGNNQSLTKQVAHKLKEMKRDMETMLLANVAANPGAAGTARATAGIGAFLTSNVSRGTGGANGTLSGTTSGYPDAAATDGTLRALTEAQLQGVIAQCWDNGAEPSLVLCGSAVKSKISNTFTGSASRYRDISDKKVVASISLYVSDFGDLKIIPTRFQRARDVLVLDPSYARVAYLQTAKQTPLAKTGHADRILLSAEYGLQIDNQKAHGIIADIDGSL